MADNHGVGQPAHRLHGDLCGKGRRIVERCHQDLRAALLGNEAPQLRLRLEKIAAAVELDRRDVQVIEALSITLREQLEKIKAEQIEQGHDSTGKAG